MLIISFLLNTVFLSHIVLNDVKEKDYEKQWKEIDFISTRNELVIAMDK